MLLLAALTGIGIGGAAHLLTRAGSGDRAAAAFHGQASWGPDELRAPSFELRDQRGSLVSLDGLRGNSVLLTFLDSRCEEQCPAVGVLLGRILRGMKPAERPVLVVVSVDPADDTPASIRKAMAAWRLAGQWRWHWLRGTSGELAPVWRNYGVAVQPTTHDITHSLVLYLIDRDGFQRTGYLFPFLSEAVTRDLRTLGEV